MPENVIECDGVEIWSESFGDPADPTVLLMTSTQSIWWEAEFCARLVEGGRHVVRYDNRDTGRSSVVDFTESPYTMDDLANDALAVLDFYGAASAHLVGCFTSGFIAQGLAIRSPERVASLTLISTTPVLREAADAVLTGATHAVGIPLPKADDEAELKEAVDPWREGLVDDRTKYIEDQLRVLALEAGSGYPFDEPHWRELVSRTYDRTRDWRGTYRQWDVILTAAPDRRPQLQRLDVPTVVIHGAEDRTLPVEHAHALAAAIPGAKLVVVPGLGHQFHQDVYPLWAQEILALTGPR